MKPLEEVVFDVASTKVKFNGSLTLAIFFSHPENNTFSITLGSQPIINPETNRYYSSKKDFNSIKKNIEKENYSLELDKELRFYLRIL